MEPSFTFRTSKQQKALFGAVADYRLKKMIKCPSEGVIRAVQEMLGPLFQKAEHRWKLQVDIAAMVMAWGLQTEDHEQVVGWVMRELFDKDLILNVDSMLEWAHPGWAFDFSEGYELEEEGIEMGIVPFVYWPRGFKDQESYTNERCQAWNALKGAILGYKEEMRRMEVPRNVPKRKRSARRKSKV